MTRVLGYGSLVTRADVVLEGWERWWGVAMDNRRAIPGYKRYRDASGAFPPVCVAFVDLRRAPGASVRGELLEVDAAGLAALDAREHNYDRTWLPELEAWTYVGSAAGRARAAAARAAGTLVVQRAYLEAVGGPPPGLPVRDLERVAV